MQNTDAPRPSLPPDHPLPTLADDAAPPPPPRLLDQVRSAIRVRHYSIRTEAAYTDWVRRFILFHGKRHPSRLGAAEVAAFLTHPAVRADCRTFDAGPGQIGAAVFVP